MQRRQKRRHRSAQIPDGSTYHKVPLYGRLQYKIKISTIADKLMLEKREFVTSEELKEYCRAFKIDHRSAVHCLTKTKYLARAFRGVFYVKALSANAGSKDSNEKLRSKGVILRQFCVKVIFSPAVPIYQKTVQKHEVGL